MKHTPEPKPQLTAGQLIQHLKAFDPDALMFMDEPVECLNICVREVEPNSPIDRSQVWLFGSEETRSEIKAREIRK